MPRLIDADTLDAKMKCTYRYFQIAADIAEAPTIDAVPVVRCRDCKWGNCYDGPLQRYECTRLLGSIQVKENDFCSYGERKEN